MILTTEVITREALKILNQSFGKTYAKHNRKLLGGNEYVHNVQREATTDSKATAAVE